MRVPVENTTVALRINGRNPGHVRASIFVGPEKGSRGDAGEITVRTEEWNAFVSVLCAGEIEFLPPLEEDE